MAVEELFSLEKPSETENFMDCGNKQLLYHGSRLSNGPAFSDKACALPRLRLLSVKSPPGLQGSWCNLIPGRTSCLKVGKQGVLSCVYLQFDAKNQA